MVHKIDSNKCERVIDKCIERCKNNHKHGKGAKQYVNNIVLYIYSYGKCKRHH